MFQSILNWLTRRKKRTLLREAFSRYARATERKPNDARAALEKDELFADPDLSCIRDNPRFTRLIRKYYR